MAQAQASFAVRGIALACVTLLGVCLVPGAQQAAGADSTTPIKSLHADGVCTAIRSLEADPEPFWEHLRPRSPSAISEVEARVTIDLAGYDLSTSAAHSRFTFVADITFVVAGEASELQRFLGAPVRCRLREVDFAKFDADGVRDTSPYEMMTRKARITVGGMRVPNKKLKGPKIIARTGTGWARGAVLPDLTVLDMWYEPETGVRRELSNVCNITTPLEGQQVIRINGAGGFAKPADAERAAFAVKPLPPGEWDALVWDQDTWG